MLESGIGGAIVPDPLVQGLGNYTGVRTRTGPAMLPR